MNYRPLGRTGVKVSPLCLGTMCFVELTDEATASRVFSEALDGGINFVDTANMYSRGACEELVGRLLERSGTRQRIVLATKFYFKMDETDPNARGSSRSHVIEQCHASLRRLKTDYIDLYQIHRPSSDVPIDETLRALDDLVRAGKVRYVGTSTFAAWQLVEALWVSKELGLNRVVSEQPPYNLLDRRIERELLPMALTYGMAVLPWSPLAGGFLAGGYRRGVARPAGSRHEKVGNRWADRHFTEACFDVVERLTDVARERGSTPSQIALAWCLARPGVASVILGPRRHGHVAEALASLELRLSAEDHARLDEVAPPGRSVMKSLPYYEADFGPHAYRW